MRRLVLVALHTADIHHTVNRLQIQTARVLRLQERALLHTQRPQPRQDLSWRQPHRQRERRGETLRGGGERQTRQRVRVLFEVAGKRVVESDLGVARARGRGGRGKRLAPTTLQEIATRRRHRLPRALPEHRRVEGRERGGGGERDGGRGRRNGDEATLPLLVNGLLRDQRVAPRSSDEGEATQRPASRREGDELGCKGGREGDATVALEGDAGVVQVEGGGTVRGALRQQQRADGEVEERLVLVVEHEEKVAGEDRPDLRERGRAVLRG